MNINNLIEKAYSGHEITKEECIEMLKLDDTSKDAFLIRAAATDLIRKRNYNSGYIFAQIGLACSPCTGNCSFCSFAKDYTKFSKIELTDEEIIEKVNELNYDGSLYGLYLMMMHEYDLDRFIECIRIVKHTLKTPTLIFSNVGDSSYESFVRMKEAGLDGVYHCWRLGEGKDTNLSPESRKETMRNAKKAGLEVLDALEPIGPEHTPEEMAEHIFFSKEMNVLQCGAMKRINVPGTSFENMGEISQLTLSKIEAVMVLTFACMDRMPIMGLHEPNIIGFVSGANMISAETGVNPRDTAEDTSKGRGWDVARCKNLLREAGFESIVSGDGTRMPLI